MDLTTSSGTLLLPGGGTAPPGGIIAGQYQVERLSDRGELGPVIVAQDLRRRRRVALKLIESREATDAAFVEQFLRAGGAATAIDSEHVRRIHEVGRLDCGTPYMVMEHIDGLDLGTLIRSDGPLGCEAAATYALQVCDALAHAHAQGIVHGDLRPENVVLTRRGDGSGCVKVLDFGIPRLPLAEAEGRQPFARTPVSPYLSPEQLRSSPAVDARSDIWGLGVLLFELLTGRPPFSGDSIAETCRRVLEKNPPELRTGSRRMDSIVRRCLEKDPQRRYPSAGELSSALAPLASTERAAASPELPMVVPQFRNGPWARLCLIAAALAISVGSMFVLGRPRSGSVTRQQSPSPRPPIPLPTDAKRPGVVPPSGPAVPTGVEAARLPPMSKTALAAPPRALPLRTAGRHSPVTDARCWSAKETSTVEIPNDRK